MMEDLTRRSLREYRPAELLEIYKEDEKTTTLIMIHESIWRTLSAILAQKPSLILWSGSLDRQLRFSYIQPKASSRHSTEATTKIRSHNDLVRAYPIAPP